MDKEKDLKNNEIATKINEITTELEETRLDRIEKLLQKQAMNGSVISEQLGIVADATKRIDARLRTVDERENSHYGELSEKILNIEEREPISDDQIEELGEAIRSRVNFLMVKYDTPSYIYEQSVKTKLITKCWADSKSHSRVRSKSGRKTAKRDFNECITYIGTWEPHGKGVMGYLEYLKEEHRKKELSKVKGVV